MTEVDPAKIDDPHGNDTKVFIHHGPSYLHVGLYGRRNHRDSSPSIGASERKAGPIFYSNMNFYAWLTIIDELFSRSQCMSPTSQIGVHAAKS